MLKNLGDARAGNTLQTSKVRQQSESTPGHRAVTPPGRVIQISGFLSVYSCLSCWTYQSCRVCQIGPLIKTIYGMFKSILYIFFCFSCYHRPLQDLYVSPANTDKKPKDREASGWLAPGKWACNSLSARSAKTLLSSKPLVTFWSFKIGLW